MAQVLLAILAGALTVGAPCVLPLLPILLGTSVGQTSRLRPLYIVSGFILAFSILGTALSWLTLHVGISAGALRSIAIVLLTVFGLLLVWPKPFELLTTRLSWLFSLVSRGDRSGNWGGFVLGVTLGVVWTPCAGPILGAILTLVATQHNGWQALALLGAYALGAGLPMLALAYGGQYLTTRVALVARYSRLLQQIFGFLIIALAVAMYFNYDVTIENQLASVFPNVNLTPGGQSPTANNPSAPAAPAMLKNYGPAPDFRGIDNWLNGPPLDLAQLKGKVVLVDFWTYSCINCIRTLPYVTKWYDTYKNQGFVVIGIHTPEFAFEKDRHNVADAIQRFHIAYPVAQDNEYGTWTAYDNQYWPAEYLIDQNGNIVYVHFGEGEYDRTENAIRQLLGLSGPAQTEPGQDLSQVGSPEMYFGTDRLSNLVPEQSPSNASANYRLPPTLPLNAFALEGRWQFTPQNVTLVQDSGKIKLKFHSGKLHLVAASAVPARLQITVDGRPQPDVTVNESALYTLFDSTDYSDHVIEITVNQGGFQAFTFTFG